MDLTPYNSIVVVVDWQERLVAAMPKGIHERNLHKAEILLDAAAAAGVPVLATEQYPKGLGPTVPSIRERLGADVEPIAKRDFSCCDVPTFREQLEASGREKVILIGMESHVCIYQTARALIALGYEAHIALDAVLSRRRFDFEVARGLYDRLGAVSSCVELIAFDWVRRAEGDVFKAISKLLR